MNDTQPYPELRLRATIPAPRQPPAQCVRCQEWETFPLGKVDPALNTCWRCRRCSHIFSPVAPEAAVGG